MEQLKDNVVWLVVLITIITMLWLAAPNEAKEVLVPHPNCVACRSMWRLP